MKKYYFLLLFIAGMANAQIVNIPNANFKAKLLAANETNTIASTATNSTIPNTFNKIDVNNDGEIQVSEAASVTLLNISNSGISDLTGIEAFASLRVLKCQNNQIPSLNLSNFPLLVWLECQNNNLTTLDASNKTFLQTLFCQNNQLTSLGLNNLPSLSNFYCQDNQLTSLDVSQIPIVVFLGCENNQIASLNASGLTHLQVLNCRSNGLTSLNVTNASSLVQLSCGDNLFTTLDLNTNTSLTSLSLYGCTNLQTLFMHNGSDESTFIDSGSWWENWVVLMNLQYICADENEIVPLREVLDAVHNFNTNLPPVLINTYCEFTPGGGYNTLSGTVRFDSDNNDCDTNDAVQPFLKMKINDGTTDGYVFTNIAGLYEFYLDAGNYEITPSVQNADFFNFSPMFISAGFLEGEYNNTSENICISANGIHQDMEIVAAPVLPARPGFDATYKIVFKNVGNQILSQDYGINFFYNQNLMSFVSSDVNPETQTPGTLSWHYNDLKPFESRSILVTMNINPPTAANPVNNGDVLIFTVNALATTDEDLSDNIFILDQIVVGSYDPNDITCLEGAVVSSTEIGEDLHYMIRFENTGTAAAENIVVKAVIDPAKFDINSLQVMNTSHLSDIRISGNVAEFIFEGILLETGGHGNVLLKIKSNDNLTVNDFVTNQADIFFDYNFPIVTNQAYTAFEVLGTNTPELENSFAIFPNPSNDIITVKSKDVTSIKSVQLFDIQGRILLTRMVNDSETTVNISSYSNGNYFLKITTDKGFHTRKIMKK